MTTPNTRRVPLVIHGALLPIEAQRFASFLSKTRPMRVLALAATRSAHLVVARHAGRQLRIPKDPVEVTTTDVLAFITERRSGGDPRVVRLVNGESGLSSRTIQCRLSSLSSMFSYLLVRGDVTRRVASLAR